MRVLAIMLVLAACGRTRSSTPAIDGGDDGPRADADPSCRQWREEAVLVTKVACLESLPVHTARTARVLVDVLHCPGDVPAMPIVGFTLEGENVVFNMSVWRSGPDCTNPETVQRPVMIKFPYAATWRTSEPTCMFDVQAPPAGSCNPGGNGCERDCDCPSGERCLSGYGFAGPIQRCATPCELDRDCVGEGACTQTADDLSFVCAPGNECDPGACPQGFACENHACTPQFTLNGSTRHACTCDSECDGGLRCVFNEGAVQGRCEAVCLTGGDGWCQGPHYCAPPSVERMGICGWIGE